MKCRTELEKRVGCDVKSASWMEKAVNRETLTMALMKNSEHLCYIAKEKSECRLQELNRANQV